MEYGHLMMLNDRFIKTIVKLPGAPIDTYTASAIIGEGGAGRVYVVTNNSGEEFALSLTPERITAERLKRFKNEILFCQNCGHPNIVLPFSVFGPSAG